jgi:hypothetical protein
VRASVIAWRKSPSMKKGPFFNAESLSWMHIQSQSPG